MRVKKSDLIHVLKSNRQRHEQFATKAKQRWRTALIRDLEKMLKDAKDGRPVKHNVALVAPLDHIADYDRVMRMIDMSVDDIIELDEQSFTSYVQDTWEWKSAFVAGLRTYFADAELESVSE